MATTVPDGLAEEVRHIQATYGVVGRDHEIAQALACLRAQRDLLIEGPVGVGKTWLAQALARHLDRPFFRVDGDERYTEQKLVGWFDPPIVLRTGYTREAFVPGPLTEAMQASGILFINELNRMPESAQNVLLPCLDERLVVIPRLGPVRAASGFLVVATQNPQEFVATSHLSEALRDRFELLRLGYQSLEEEVRIVRQATGVEDEELCRRAVLAVRASREHSQVKRGASVRAAISAVRIASELGGADHLLAAARLAFPTRIELREDATKSLDEVIRELVEGGEKKG